MSHNNHLNPSYPRMWLVSITLFLSVALQAQADVVFLKIEYTSKPEYVKYSYRITNRDNKSYLNCNITIVQPWDNKITLKTDIFFLPNTRTPVFQLPKVKFCTLSTFSKSVPFLSDLMKLVEKYSNGTGLTKCPVMVGDYQMENIYVDDSMFKELLWVRSNSKYMMNLVIADENGMKPVQVAMIKYYVQFK